MALRQTHSQSRAGRSCPLLRKYILSHTRASASDGRGMAGVEASRCSDSAAMYDWKKWNKSETIKSHIICKLKVKDVLFEELRRKDCCFCVL